MGLSLLGSSFPLSLHRFQQIDFVSYLLGDFDYCKHPCRCSLCLHTIHCLSCHNFLIPFSQPALILKAAATVGIVQPMCLLAWHLTTSPHDLLRVATHPRSFPNSMSGLFLHHTFRVFWHQGRQFRAMIFLAKLFRFHLCSIFCPLLSYVIQFPAIKCCFLGVSAMILERLYRNDPLPLFHRF